MTVIDTGGFVPHSKEEPLAAQVRLQAQVAVEECHVVVFVVDAKTGLTPADEELARLLRKQRRLVVLVANKVDAASKTIDAVLGELHRLGLGEPLGISAEHNLGFGELEDALLAKLPPMPAAVDEAAGDRPLRIAVVGRPNVGKSSLVNALLGQERVIVSDVAGTTRDPIDTHLEYKKTALVLTDTAGIRRKAAISMKVEQFSVLGAMRAIEDSDVVVLVVDANEAGVEQDLKIASLAAEKGRGLLVAVNKWDTQHGKMKEADFREGLKWEMSFIAWVPMVFVSAKTGDRVSKVLDVAMELAQQQHFRASTPMLNRVVKHVTEEHPMPVVGGRRLKIYYAAQVGHAPPSFAFVCNKPDDIPDRYQRYLENYLRKVFELKVPMRLFFRERPGGAQRDTRVQAFKSRATAAKRRRR